MLLIETTGYVMDDIRYGVLAEFLCILKMRGRITLTETEATISCES